jgi:large subunit ribosomal protein L25
MEQKELSVELRNETGKGICRRLRTAGRVPGIVYGKGMEPVAVSIDLRELSGAITGEGGRNTLITLKGCEGLAGVTAIVSEMDRTALKGKIRHVDLHKINMDENVRVEVKINLVGTAKGVKDGGLLDFALHKIELECLPALIPDQVNVDVTSLTIGHSIHVADLDLPAGVKPLADAKASVVSILGRAREEAAPAA